MIATMAMDYQDIAAYIQQIPKIELHMHIEGSLEPELMFKLAAKNHVKIPYQSALEVKKAYQFNSLQDFLDIYYAGASVLQTEQDFYELTFAYLKKAREQNIVHTEFFFDPQTHTARGIKFDTVIHGIHRAQIEAEKKLGVSSKLILCFLRHLSAAEAEKTFKEALPYKKWIVAVGLDSGEKNNPPSKFKDVFDLARKAGFLTVAHAGEEGPPEYIWEALDLLKISRLDHGNHATTDEKLMQALIQRQMPLTMCPLSNYRLKGVPDLTKHPLKQMLDRGLLVTVNSDDPAYFGGYLNENYLVIQKALKLTPQDIYRLAENSIKASFLTSQEKERLFKKLENFKPK